MLFLSPTPAAFSKPPPSPQPLRIWIWRAFARSALIPLLLVEVVLIVAYVAANRFVLSENRAAVRSVAGDEVSRIATRRSSGLRPMRGNRRMCGMCAGVER